MSLSNKEIRALSKEKGVYLWRIAEVLNISEPTMTRKMRRELSPDEKDRILSIIDKLSQEQEAG